MLFKQDTLLGALREKQKRQEIMQNELEGLKNILNSEKQNSSALTCDRDKFISLCDEKDSVLQAALLENRSMEARLAKLSKLELENNTKKELVKATNQVLQKIQDELKIRSSELHAAEEAKQRLVNEKLLPEEIILTRRKVIRFRFLRRSLKNNARH